MSQSLRIALVADHFLPRLGGIEVQVSELAARLAAAGHNVVIATTTPGEAKFGSVAVCRLGNGHTQGLGLPLSLRPFARWKRTLWTSEFDVVHIHGSVVSPLAYATVLWCRKWRIPHVFTLHSEWQRTARVARLLNKPLRWSSALTRWTAVSRFAADGLRRAGCGDVSVLPNGIDLADWQVERRESPELQVVSVMRLHREKRPQDLVCAMPEIDSHVAESARPQLVLVGDGSHRRHVERLANRLGLADRVKLPGRLPREQVKEVLATAAVFALPTPHETFGLAVLEARCVGLPVVVLRNSGAAEQLEDGRTGVIAENRADIARAIAELLNDPIMRRDLAEATRETAHRYDWTHVLAQHLEAYDEARVLMGCTSGGWVHRRATFRPPQATSGNLD